MLTEKERQFNDILVGLAEELDIPPSKYKQAVDRYSAVGNWLKVGEVDIYPQGSFRLGTVVRPIQDGKEADYDVDLVCQLPMNKFSITAESLKQMVGNRLKANLNYSRILDKEGRRCWTLEYAEEDGIGFHIDVLPSVPATDTVKIKLNEANVPSEYHKHAIDITDRDKDTGICSWLPSGSNPRGYALWFEDFNKSAFVRVEASQRKVIVEKYASIYASVETVPDALIRTPLQRAIQILKRHRDMYFIDNPETKPISMIITTLATQAYNGETELYTTIANIVDKLTNYNISMLIRYVNGKWWIPNPVNPAENFADRWNDEDKGSEKVYAFFNWLKKISSDFANLVNTKGLPMMSEGLRNSFGERITNSALKKYGRTFREDRESGKLKIAFGTGILGSKGDAAVRNHTFYGS
ncbi:MAG: nucleotidyltransferase [Sedimentisphaerales bacterium]